MLTECNMVRRAAATMMAACLGVCSLSHNALGRQAVDGQPAAAQPADQLDASPPAPDVAISTFNAVKSWLSRWQTPMDPAGQPPVCAAAITLRFQGSVVGRGTVISTEPRGASDVVMAAASGALNEAKERMPVERDALFEENLKAASGQVMLSVELAGRPVPLTINEFADAIDLVGPGLDGVAVRMGDRMEAMFPETMLVTGTDAAAALRGLVSKVSGDATLGLKKAGELREQHGVQFYRFEVVQVAQVKAGGSPEFLHRGGAIVQPSALNTGALYIWAEHLAEFLWNQRWPGDEKYGIQGTYDPIRGINESPFAGPAQQALVALAMWRRIPLIRGPEIRRARESINDWVFDLALANAAVAPGEAEPWVDPVSAALWWRVLDEMLVFPIEHSITGSFREVRDPNLVDMKQRCRDRLAEALKSPGQLQPESRAAVAWVLSGARGESFDQDEAQRFVSSTLVNTPPSRLPGSLPWLGWAARGKAAAPAFREVRAQLWQHQLRSEDLPANAGDVSGGVLFTTSKQPLPTWQVTRPLAFVATMLGDPNMTEPAEVPKELARLLASLRFLNQLGAHEAECHMYKDPARALGGIRNSLFDQRMQPEANAMTLLTVCETLKSLEAIRRRPEAAKNVEAATPEEPQQTAPK